MVQAKTTPALLLSRLDGGGESSREAADELVRLGDEVIDDLLESVAEINGRMNGSIRNVTPDPIAEMARLERRVRVMERLRNPITIRTLFDALADSALAAEAYRQKRDAAYERGELGTPLVAYEHMLSARSLNKATINALVVFGGQVIPFAKSQLSMMPPAVRKALKKVISRLEHKWWRFW